MSSPGLRAPGVAWVALAALLAAGSLLALWLPAAAIAWQPGLAAREPWRALSAAFVHWSGLHLHHAGGQVQARIALLDAHLERGGVPPGGRGLVQAVLDAPAAGA